MESKTLLHHSLCQYLKTNGFSKTLQKFLSEAKLDLDDSRKDCSLDLEQVYYNFLETRDCIVSVEETVSKKNKWKSGKSDCNAVDNQCQTKDKFRNAKKSEDIVTDDLVPESAVISKMEKKRKTTSGSIKEVAEQVRPDVLTESDNGIVNEPLLDELKKKHKDKKKKKAKSGSQKDDFQTSKDAAINKENKDSKKRKRLASEDNNSQPIDKVAIEGKRRKTEGMEESQLNMQLTELEASLGSDGHTDKVSKEQNGKVCFNNSQERAIKQLDTDANGNLEKYIENSSVQKSSKKQHNGSVEPKTVNAFQRVKIDKVVFTDERLQDNSYWAKDGAEIGYGAKAQEVLGQVRGRDFRHEKTKKKRGSYRGGQIDLHSHSVKFNYSDED